MAAALVRRADSVLAVVDVQPHERGLARMSEAGVERNHCKGLIFEWLHTVADALEVIALARERFGESPLRL